MSSATADLGTETGTGIEAGTDIEAGSIDDIFNSSAGEPQKRHLRNLEAASESLQSCVQKALLEFKFSDLEVTATANTESNRIETVVKISLIGDIGTVEYQNRLNDLADAASKANTFCMSELDSVIDATIAQDVRLVFPPRPPPSIPSPPLSPPEPSLPPLSLIGRNDNLNLSLDGVNDLPQWVIYGAAAILASLVLIVLCCIGRSSCCRKRKRFHQKQKLFDGPLSSIPQLTYAGGLVTVNERANVAPLTNSSVRKGALFAHSLKFDTNLRSSSGEMVYPPYPGAGVRQQEIVDTGIRSGGKRGLRGGRGNRPRQSLRRLFSAAEGNASLCTGKASSSSSGLKTLASTKL